MTLFPNGAGGAGRLRERLAAERGVDLAAAGAAR